MTGQKMLIAGTLLSAFSVIAPTGCAGWSGRAVPVRPALPPASASSSASSPGALAPPRRAAPATVAYVIDGDTIVAVPRAHAGARGTRRVRVRLLGLDAPEDTRRRGCFGAPATAALRRLLPEGAAILVAVDRRRADPYGRALGYVWRADGTFVNRVLVRRGYATTMFLPPAGPYRAELAAAEALARTARAGLWRACRRPP